MTLSVRQADLDQDRQIIIEFLYQSLTRQSDSKRFEWLYEKNPHGAARVWLAIDSRRDMIVGTAAAFPRVMQVSGKDVICWNLGDFAIDRNFRSLGPGILLQKACLGPVLKGEIPFFYDHPSDSMMAIYKRLGISESGWVQRFAKPLRIDQKLENLFVKGVITRGVGKVGNWLLEVRDHRICYKHHYDVAIHDGYFSEEFTDLDKRVSRRYRVCGRRTAEYLNWRYSENPLSRYQVLTVRNQGELRAYAIFVCTERSAILVDFFGEEEPGIPGTILSAVTDILRKGGVFTLSIPVLEFSVLIPIMKRCHFYPRERAPFIVGTQQGGHFDGLVTNIENWFLTHGDRDI
jgi:hypothetical protein